MNNHQEHHHDHGHEHGHDHCGCGHHHEHSHCRHTRAGAKVLTIRLHSGIAGDMFLCGLMCMLKMNNEQAEEILNGILPALKGSIKLTDKFVNGIRGAHCSVELPHEHEHRNLADVFAIIRNADISDNAKRYAEKAFTLIAEAEGRVHGLPFTQVHFHEVGALDSILDICFTCELYTRLNPDRLIVSPLPIADGSIVCAHGVIPSPAPAVKALLEDVLVRPFLAEGETVTPTGLALLKALDAEFGPWPAMTVKTIETVYGTYVYEGVPNGATFAFGEELGA